MPPGGELRGVDSDVTVSPLDAREFARSLRLALDVVPQVVWVTTLRPERVVYLSPAFEPLWGMACETLKRSPRCWLERIRQEDRVRVESAFDALCAGDICEYDLEYSLVSRSGDIPVHDRRRLGCSADGSVHYVAGTVQATAAGRDLSAEHFYDARSGEVLGAMLCGVAHHLNNTLMSVIGFAGLASAKLQVERDGKLAEYLSEIHQAGHRAKSVVGNLVECLQHGSEQPTRINLDIFADQCRTFISAILPSSIEVRFHIDAGREIFAYQAELRFALVCLALYAKNRLNGSGVIMLGVGSTGTEAKAESSLSLRVAGWPPIVSPQHAWPNAVPFTAGGDPCQDAYLGILQGIATRRGGRLQVTADAVCLNIPAAG